MSPFIVFLIICMLYLGSKPRLRRYVERDDLYLSRNWTSFVNAFFITLVVCSHGLGLFHTSIYVQNVGSIIFAVGVTWFVGSFSWQTPSRYLIWLGGGGLFIVYMYHLLPMRVLTKMELNLAPPYLVWLAVVVTTGILAIIASIAHNKINNLIFRKQ